MTMQIDELPAGEQNQCPDMDMNRVVGTHDILMLCSDGLYGEVSGNRIAEILGSGKNMNDVCSDLVEEAVKAGGRDNITVICLKI